MVVRKSRKESARKLPKVRIVRPSGRPFQLRYLCPIENREVRISVGSRDELEAKHLKAELEARLLLGIETRPAIKSSAGPNMSWSEFREQYRSLHLATVRDGTAMHAESRLDIAERILKPRTLGNFAIPSQLQKLQVRLLAGAASKLKRPRSRHTVKSYMNTILSSLSWARLQGWLPTVPEIRRLKTPKLKQMKGRPITGQEFAMMLAATPEVVGEVAAASWQHVLHGLWQSALRLDELIHVSWDKPETIRPIWKTGQLPVLDIPAALQKNDTEDSIPLVPWFEELLLQTPMEKRTGWIFEPLSLQLQVGRKVRHQRLNAEWVGRVVGKIGKAAGVVVEAANESTGRASKFASAHDLRRSCAERLREAGVPPLVICRVLRHSSWETTRKHYAPGNTQQDAGVLRDILRQTS